MRGDELKLLMLARRDELFMLQFMPKHLLWNKVSGNIFVVSSDVCLSFAVRIFNAKVQLFRMSYTFGDPNGN